MKKTVLKIISCVFAVILLCSVPFTTTAAPENAAGFVNEDEVSGDAVTLKEIPLLVIIASFDANKNGINDYDPENKDKLYADKTSPYYGEQWAKTKPEDHWNNFFGETGYTLTNYYKEMTCGHLTYVPAEFDTPDKSWTVTNGVISVVAGIKHPTASGDAAGAIRSIIKACDEYIDFSKFDTNKDGKIGQQELGIVILNAGCDHSYSGKYQDASNPQGYFSVHGTSQVTNVTMDGVSITNVNPGGNVSNIGEYRTNGAIMTIGVPVHELAHNLGAEDLYDRNGGGGGSIDSTWPQPSRFSLQCTGNSNGIGSRSSGNCPAYLDPYQRIRLGWVESEVVTDGTYTLHSTLSGKYKVLRVNTPDPNEYYLIEIRLKEGFETALTAAGDGGIMVWHIDESINDKYFESGEACSSYNGVGETTRHDPGIVPLFRTGWNETGTRMRSKDPSDPYYYLSDDTDTAIFDSSNYRSPTNNSVSLNSYPSNWTGTKTYNLHIEVLSKPGQEMQIKISTENNAKLLPKVTAVSGATTQTSITIEANTARLNGEKLVKCGFIVADNAALENGKYYEGTLSSDKSMFSASIEGLTENTKYYFKGVLENENGESDGVIASVSTKAKPVEKTYFLVNIYKNLKEGERYTEVKVKLGETLKYSFPLEKTGYVFGGWYLDKTFTREYSMAYTQDEYSVITIYGKWIEETEAVSFKFMNAETEYPVFAVKAGEAAEEPTPAAKEGYTFGGWYSDAEFTKTFDFKSPVKAAGEVRVYAKWTAEGETETTKSTETTSETTSSDILIETTTTTANGGEKETKSNTAIIIVIVAVAVFVTAGGVYFFVIKKKKVK